MLVRSASAEAGELAGGREPAHRPGMGEWRPALPDPQCTVREFTRDVVYQSFGAQRGSPCIPCRSDVRGGGVGWCECTTLLRMLSGVVVVRLALRKSIFSPARHLLRRGMYYSLSATGRFQDGLQSARLHICSLLVHKRDDTTTAIGRLGNVLS